MRRAALSLVAAVRVAAVAGCGDNVVLVPTVTSAAPASGHLTAQQRAAIRRRKATERPRFSNPTVNKRLARLNGGRRRIAVVSSLQRSIFADARRRVARHQIDGPVKDVTCETTRDDRAYEAQHPDAPILRYSCLAVTFRSTTKPPMSVGSPYAARVDFAAPRYARCLFTPVGGEGTHTAITFAVEPSPACVADPPQHR
jgi:hypothetical protein